MAGMLNENAALRLGLAEKLASMLDPGHLALTRMADKLIALRQQANQRVQQSPGCFISMPSFLRISDSVRRIKKRHLPNAG